MDPAAIALAVTVVFLGLAYAFSDKNKSPTASGPGGGACPLGSIPAGMSPLCWAVQTAPDLTFLTKDALTALVKGRLTLAVGTPVTVFATNSAYPKSVMVLAG